MHELYIGARQTYPLSLPVSVTVTGLFCLLGLLMSAAVLPIYSPSDVFWVVAHLE